MKLAYPTFEEQVKLPIAKDYFVRGLGSKLQVALKAEKEFSTSDIKTLGAEAVRLEIAGVTDKQSVATFNGVGNDGNEWINVVTGRVFEKVQVMNASNNHEHTDKAVNTNYFNRKFPKDYRTNDYPNRSNNPRCTAEKGDNRGYRVDNSRRSWNSTEHFVRNCPKRYCQASGEQGHDQSDRNCKRFQP